MCKVSKINRSIYEVSFPKWFTYEIEKFPDGSWMLFRVRRYSRDYEQDFATKREALAFVKGMYHNRFPQ